MSATHNAIAVGASATDSDTATVTRQITGVAAGTYDTDAVNVAQLKAASTALTSGGLKFGANANADTAATSAVVTNALNTRIQQIILQLKYHKTLTVTQPLRLSLMKIQALAA